MKGLIEMKGSHRTEMVCPLWDWVYHFIFRGDHVDDLLMRHVRMMQFLGTRW